MFANTLFLWLHFLSAALLLAHALVSVTAVTISLRSADPKIVAFVLRHAHFCDWAFGFPAYVLIAITGWALTDLQGFSFDQSWLVAGVALYLLMGACWLQPLYMQWRQTEAIDEAMNEGANPDSDLIRKRRGSSICAWLPLPLMMIAAWLMIARPDIW